MASTSDLLKQLQNSRPTVKTNAQLNTGKRYTADDFMDVAKSMGGTYTPPTPKPSKATNAINAVGSALGKVGDLTGANYHEGTSTPWGSAKNVFNDFMNVLNYTAVKPIQTLELSALAPMQQMSDFISGRSVQSGQVWIDQMKDLWSNPNSTVTQDAINKYFGAEGGSWYSPGNVIDDMAQMFGPSAVGGIANRMSKAGTLGLAPSKGVGTPSPKNEPLGLPEPQKQLTPTALPEPSLARAIPNSRSAQRIVRPNNNTANDMQRQLDDLKSLYESTRNPKVKARMDEVSGMLRSTSNKSMTDDLNDILTSMGFSKGSADDLIKATGRTTADPLNKLREVVSKTSLKDLNSLNVAWNDVYRNFEKVLGGPDSEAFKFVKREYLDAFDQAKKVSIQEQRQVTNQLYNTVVKDLGIKKGSKESALVQKFGEKRISLDQLKKEHPDKWQNIQKAEKIFRQQYDNYIDRMNEVLKVHDPKRVIKKREDYFHHFDEVSALRNIFDQPGQASDLAGASSRLNSKKFNWMNKRSGKDFKDDAVGGFLRYLPGASQTIHITPHISKFRDLGRILDRGIKSPGEKSNFSKFIDQFANDLGGKPNPVDDAVKGVIGDRSFELIRWATNRVKANMVMLNPSSALAQSLNIPNGIAFAKQYSIKGASETIKQISKANRDAISQSGFLAERYGRKMYRKFDERLIEQPRRLAEWMLEAVDEMGTRFVWNSIHQKGLADNVADPIKYADDHTRRLVAGRGVGEVPLGQRATTVQAFMPFTLEVGNSFKVMTEFAKTDKTALMLLFTANYFLNDWLTEIRGFGGSIDPIDAGIDASENLAEGDILGAGGRMAGEFLSATPVGQFLASAYPQNGSIGPLQLPTREELFGEGDPTRFGVGPIAFEGIENPANLILPFGGNQLKKTAGAIEAQMDGAVMDKGGDQVLFPMDDDLLTQIQTLLFGKWATEDARNYFKENKQPLSVQQSQVFKNASDARAYYENLQERRKREKENRKAKEGK